MKSGESGISCIFIFKSPIPGLGSIILAFPSVVFSERIADAAAPATLPAAPVVAATGAVRNRTRHNRIPYNFGTQSAVDPLLYASFLFTLSFATK